MCCRSLVVAKLATPTSIPAWRPDAGSGLAGTSSHESTSTQRRPSRLTWIVFTRPSTGRCTVSEAPAPHTVYAMGRRAGAVRGDQQDRPAGRRGAPQATGPSSAERQGFLRCLAGLGMLARDGARYSNTARPTSSSTQQSPARYSGTPLAASVAIAADACGGTDMADVTQLARSSLRTSSMNLMSSGFAPPPAKWP